MKPQWLNRSVIMGPGLALCLSEKDYQGLLKKIKEPIDRTWIRGDKNATAHQYPETEHHIPLVLVCIQNWEGKDPVAVAGLLCHEAVHVWQFFLEIIGEVNESSEFEAYSIQWISQQLMWEFVRQTEGG